MRFEQRCECEKFLTPYLFGSDLIEETDAAILKALTDECADVAPDSSDALELQIGHWVIRDDDLKLFGTVCETIKILAATNFVIRNLQTAALVSLAVALVTLLRAAYRGGAWLSSDQSQVLAVMRTAEVKPVALPQLTELLGKSWSEDRVRSALDGLSCVVTRHEVVSLVKEVSDGWVVLGV